MDKVISVNILLKELETIKIEGLPNRKKKEKIINQISKICINLPSANINENIEEPKEWILTDQGYECPSCKCLSSLQDKNLKSRFCPWCGRKMKE